VSVRVARSRALVAEGYALAAVARVAGISRQALYRIPKPRTAPQRRPPAAGSIERASVEVAKENPTDGYRMVWALTRRKLGVAVNRKRVLRVMRQHRLIQRRRREPGRRRPRFFRVERPAQLWHMDMTAVWVAEHGWCYLNAIIDCCTREIVGWGLEVRCRAVEAIAVVERAACKQAIPPGTLTLGTDNGSAFTARRFRQVLSGLGIRHRRGGYRDPESQAFIELVREAQGTLHLAPRVRNPRPGKGGDRRPHRPLPRPPPPGPRLPDPQGGPSDLGRCPGATTKSGRLRCQHRRGAVHQRPASLTSVFCSPRRTRP
jgi:putative transposase